MLGPLAGLSFILLTDFINKLRGDFDITEPTLQPRTWNLETNLCLI